MQQEYKQLCMDKVGKCVALRLKDVSEVTGYSIKTLYKYRASGALAPDNTEGHPIFNYLSIWSLMTDR